MQWLSFFSDGRAGQVPDGADWAFEEAELPGAFLEFVEAADRETLTRAHEAAPDPVIDPNRVYMEVELSK